MSEIAPLLELTLQSGVISQNLQLVDQVLSFGREHRYILSVTDQVCKFVLK